MTVTEKQQALLQGIVLEDSSLPEITPEFNDQEIPKEELSRFLSEHPEGTLNLMVDEKPRLSPLFTWPILQRSTEKAVL